MAAADGKDAASGALGAVVGEITAQELSRVLKGKLQSGDITQQDVESWMDRGVDIAKLTAGMAAAIAGGDVNTAAQTGGNAAEHNVLPLIILGGMIALELADKGIQTYNAWQFAKAIQEGNTAKAEEYGTELAISLGTDAIAGNAIFLKMLNGFGLVALSTKIGQKVEKVAVAVAEKAKFADSRLTDHFIRHGSDFGAQTAAEYEKIASNFLTKAKPEGVLEKVRPNTGDILRYNPTTNEFGILSNNGVIRTYFKPKRGLEYFNAQK